MLPHGNGVHVRWHGPRGGIAPSTTHNVGWGCRPSATVSASTADPVIEPSFLERGRGTSDLKYIGFPDGPIQVNAVFYIYDGSFNVSMAGARSDRFKFFSFFLLLLLLFVTIAPKLLLGRINCQNA